MQHDSLVAHVDGVSERLYSARSLLDPDLGLVTRDMTVSEAKLLPDLDLFVHEPGQAIVVGDGTRHDIASLEPRQRHLLYAILIGIGRRCRSHEEMAADAQIELTRPGIYQPIYDAKSRLFRRLDPTSVLGLARILQTRHGRHWINLNFRMVWLVADDDLQQSILRR